MQARLVFSFGLLLFGTSAAAAQTSAARPALPCDLTPEQFAVGARPTDSLSVPVKYLSGPMTKYPNAQRVAGIQGKVTVQFVVDQAGKPEPCSLKITATSDTAFNQSATNTILGAVFEPGMLNGAPVRALVTQAVNFVIHS